GRRAREVGVENRRVRGDDEDPPPAPLVERTLELVPRRRSAREVSAVDEEHTGHLAGVLRAGRRRDGVLGPEVEPLYLFLGPQVRYVLLRLRPVHRGIGAGQPKRGPLLQRGRYRKADRAASWLESEELHAEGGLDLRDLPRVELREKLVDGPLPAGLYDRLQDRDSDLFHRRPAPRVGRVKIEVELPERGGVGMTLGELDDLHPVQNLRNVFFERGPKNRHRERWKRIWKGGRTGTEALLKKTPLPSWIC